MGSDDKFFQPRDHATVSEDTDETLPLVNIGPIEALEAYSAEHPEGVDELKEWHWKKFESFYTAFLKRKAVEEANQTKNAMISGLWSNSNYDDDKNTRKNALTNIEELYNKAIYYIYSEKTEEQEYDRMMKDPFFAAINESDDKSDAPNP